MQIQTVQSLFSALPFWVSFNPPILTNGCCLATEPHSINCQLLSFSYTLSRDSFLLSPLPSLQQSCSRLFMLPLQPLSSPVCRPQHCWIFFFTTSCFLTHPIKKFGVLPKRKVPPPSSALYALYRQLPNYFSLWFLVPPQWLNLYPHLTGPLHILIVPKN